MRVLALCSFPFSRDGVTSVQAIADTEADIPDGLVAGLVAAGYVAVIDQESEPTEPAREPLIPEIPPDWIAAAPPKRRRRS